MRHTGRLLLLILLLAAIPAIAETVLVLQSGEEVHVPAVAFNGKVFTLPDDRHFAREMVNEVRFVSPAEVSQINWRYDPARYAGLFAKGKELAQKYPDRPGVILEDIGYFKLETDGTNYYDYHFVGLVLKEKARSWGRVGSWLDPVREKLAGPFGVVIHPDGTFKVAGPENLTRTEPYRGTIFFDRGEVLRLQIPDVRVGDLVEYWYRKTTVKPVHPDFFFPEYYFQTTSPVAISSLDVIMPAAKKLYYEARNMPADRREPAITNNPDGTVSYRWVMTDVPPLETEPRMAPELEYVPVVRARAIETWDPIYDVLTEFYHSRMVVTDKVKQTTAEVVGDATNVEDKIARIYQFAQRKIRYISIKTDFGTGISGHAAEVTLANQFGDCTDKAILLSTMLKAIGVEAHPIILGTYGYAHDLYAVPILSGNHAITHVFLNGRSFFLDATASTYRYPYFRWDDHGQPYADALSRATGFIDIPTADSSRGIQTWDLQLDTQGGATITRVDTSTGIFEASYRAGLEEIDQREREKELREMILGYGPGAELISFDDENVTDFNKPLKMTLVFRLPKLAKKTGRMWVIDLPGLPDHFSRVDNETRRTALLSPTNITEEETFDVHLPANWQVVDLPREKIIRTPKIEFEGRYEPIAGGFRVFYRIISRDTRVSPEEYPDYRKTMIEIESFFARRAFAREVQP
jgi:transglutaminase-like putative cysteine protease